MCEFLGHQVLLAFVGRPLGVSSSYSAGPIRYVKFLRFIDNHGNRPLQPLTVTANRRLTQHNVDLTKKREIRSKATEFLHPLSALSKNANEYKVVHAIRATNVSIFCTYSRCLG